MVHHSQEALRLAETFAGHSCAHVEVGAARGGAHTPGTYLGSGAVVELARHCAAADPARCAPGKACNAGHLMYRSEARLIHRSAPRRVFVNATLSGVQQRNLSAAWGRPVLDRVGLIIAIFGQRARTREARLQVRPAL